VNLLFTIDRAYLPYFKVCIRSIARFPTQGGYRIYVMHTGLAPEDFEALAAEFGPMGCAFAPIEVDPAEFRDFPESSRYPQMMYYRIFAAKFLPGDVDRVLYLDPDIIALRPLDELYALPFDGALFCACTHVREFLTRVNQFRLGLTDAVPYINTGVLLMNIAALRREQREEEVVRYARDRGQWFTLPDQDIITALYGHRIRLLDTMIYNLSDRMLAFYNVNPRLEKRGLSWVKENAVLIHYCGANKPWKKNYIGVLDRFYHEVAGDAEE
jgi:lipopolysaccharide biosynthesis glycosyltransferase